MTKPNVDWDKVHTLLNSANLARQWPKLKHLEDLALVELEGVGKEPKQEERVVRTAIDPTTLRKPGDADAS